MGIKAISLDSNKNNTTLQTQVSEVLNIHRSVKSIASTQDYLNLEHTNIQCNLMLVTY